MKENADSYELWNRFCVPPSDARTAPFWIWNSSMEESEITESLDELKSHGFGGVFIHPRPCLLYTSTPDPFLHLNFIFQQIFVSAF